MAGEPCIDNILVSVQELRQLGGYPSLIILEDDHIVRAKFMSIKLFDTFAGKKRDFTPMNDTRVTLYCCGPTVYSFAHIGNARAAVAADILFRVLRDVYGDSAVVYARNITDVDDKIIATAVEQGVAIADITEKYARIYNEDLAALNCLPPTHQPKATESIDDMIVIIEKLIADGFAYVADGHVFFDVSKYEAYGALSGNTLDALRGGDRVGEGETARKKNAADFVLWKPSQSGIGWDAPFGEGRPGWHIECSAMIEKVLGGTIDIHCGGQDLKFPHHENEIAQSQCAHGVPLANYWVHNGFLQMDSTKMSKSLGNVKLVHDLLDTWDGEVLRFALLSGLYRMELDWTDDLLKQAKATLDGWYRLLDKDVQNGDVQSGDVDVQFVEILCDDLNTPSALARLSALAKAGDIAALRASATVLGLLQKDADTWFKGKGQEGGLSDDAIDALIIERAEARASKNWGRSDEIRDLFAAENIVLEDGADGTTWRRG